jgi:hypothetical protein
MLCHQTPNPHVPQKQKGVTMEILTGLFPSMVLQRNDKNVSYTAITGKSSANGDLYLTASEGKKPVKGFNKPVKIGKASAGAIKATLAGLPAGGPYTLQLSISSKGKPADTLTVKDVCVGDVWIAAGQSNMQGCGNYVDRAKPHKLVRAFYMTDKWAVAEDPIHQLAIAVDPVHNDGKPLAVAPATTKGVGPAIAFAKDMHKRTGVPQGILACAHGGTSMAQWSPELKSKAGHSLYGATIRRFEKNGSAIKGVIWYQGESDAGEEQSKVFTEKLKALVAAFRKDCKNPKLPFAQVQISRVINFDFFAKHWNIIQDKQRLLQSSVKGVATIPAIDLSLDDLIHISGRDMQVLGARLADAMATLLGHKKANPLPIDVDKVTLGRDAASGLADVIVSFKNVVGTLSAKGGRPVGFELVDTKHIPGVYDVQIESPNSIRAKTNLTPAAFGDKQIIYGLGPNPVCNLVDSANRAVPMFGPIPVGEPRALSPFAQTWEVSGFEPGKGDLSSLDYMQATSYDRIQRTFPNRFIDLHMEAADLGSEDRLVIFKTHFDVPEAMKLLACVGYDGPVKVWIDGKQVYHDPAGTNPAWEDQGKSRIEGTPGKHEVVIAFGTNNNRAWGIFFRFERTDVHVPTLKENLSAYKLPTFA